MNEVHAGCWLWNTRNISVMSYGPHMGFPGGSDGKASACSAGDLGLILGLGRSLEKEMATHSSTLAWKIPWTEEPGRLQTMGSQRVRHDWVIPYGPHKFRYFPKANGEFMDLPIFHVRDTHFLYYCFKTLSCIMEGGWVITLPGIFFTVFLQMIGGVCEKGLPDPCVQFPLYF